MNVRQAMTPAPITVSTSTTLDEAIDLMDRQGICHLPVVDGVQLVGVVSDRDLLEATGWLPARVLPVVRESEVPGRVEEVMRTDAVVASPEEDVIEAGMEMLVQSVGCLPVLEDGGLVGILAMSDVLRVYVEACRDASLEPGADPGASEVMTHNVLSIHPDSTLEEARELCLENDIRHLPVIQEGALVGILSDRDLRAAAGRGRRSSYPVRELMTTPVVTASMDTPLTRCGERLIEHGIGSLPIVHEDQLRGVLSGYDIVGFALEALRVNS